MPPKTLLLVLPACDYGTDKDREITAAMESEGVKVVNPATSELSYDDMMKSCDKCCFAGFDHDLHSEEAPSGWMINQGVRRPARRISQQIYQMADAFLAAGKPVYYVNYVLMDGALATPIKFIEHSSWEAGYTLLNRHQTEALYCAAGF